MAISVRAALAVFKLSSWLLRKMHARVHWFLVVMDLGDFFLFNFVFKGPLGGSMG